MNLRRHRVRAPGSRLWLVLPLLVLGRVWADEATVSLQVTLDRLGFSPGVIDGRFGSQTRAALLGWQQANGMPADGDPNGPHAPARLPADQLYATYVISTNDLAALGPYPKDWRERSLLPRLACETLAELLAERFHCKEAYLQQLNIPNTNWTVGTVLKVPRSWPALPLPAAGRIRVFLEQKFIRVYDAQDRLTGHFPCSIAAREEKRPVGQLSVAVVAPNPNYTFNPENFPELDPLQRSYGRLIIPPGPNNPVGTAWIGLSKPGYGIHGTPLPEDIGKTSSHGCFRLANWNAERLLRLVSVGTPVEVHPTLSAAP